MPKDNSNAHSANCRRPSSHRVRHCCRVSQAAAHTWVVHHQSHTQRPCDMQPTCCCGCSVVIKASCLVIDGEAMKHAGICTAQAGNC